MSDNYEEAKKAQNEYEIKKVQDDLLWKNIHKFARKWNLGACMIAVPECALAELEHEFDLRFPTEDFDKEWKICVEN